MESWSAATGKVVPVTDTDVCSSSEDDDDVGVIGGCKGRPALAVIEVILLAVADITLGSRHTEDGEATRAIPAKTGDV